jgi:hypothetical protein
MNCTEAQKMLQQQLDGAPGGDRLNLDQHLRSCGECRGMHAAAHRLEDGLRLLALPLPPPDFTSAVVGRVLADQRARQRSRRRWYAAAALAASLLLAVFLSPWGRNAQVYVSGLFGTRSEPAPVLPGPIPEKKESTPSPSDMVAQSGSGVARIWGRITDETSPKISVPTSVLTGLARLGSESTNQPKEGPAESLTGLRQGAAVAWDSVEAPMRRATDLWSRMTPTISKP